MLAWKQAVPCARARVRGHLLGVMEVGFIEEKPFQKAFAKGLAKILAGTFFGSDLATGRDDEGSPARRRFFGKVLQSQLSRGERLSR